MLRLPGRPAEPAPSVTSPPRRRPTDDRRSTRAGRSRPPGTPVRQWARPALPQPGAVLARLQRAGPPRGEGRPESAPGAGEVPGDLRLEPGRVLPGPGRRPAPAGRPPRPFAARPTDGPPRSSWRRSGRASRPSSRSRAPLFARIRAEAGRGRRPDRRLRRRARAPRPPARTVHRGGLPGPHAAGRRPGPPVPVHLHAQPVDRGRPARPGDRRAPLRPGQGAAGPAPPDGDRPDDLRPARPGDRQQPRHPVHRPGDRRGPPLPGHPQRRPRDRGGRGRRPADGDRGGAPPATLRRGGPARGRAEHAGLDPAAPAQRDRPDRGRRLRHQRDARPDRAVADRRPGPARPAAPGPGRRSRRPG